MKSNKGLKISSVHSVVASMDTLAVGVLNVDTLEVLHAPDLMSEIHTWDACTVKDLDDRLFRRFGVRPAEYVLLQKNGQVAVQYLSLPSPTMSPNWIKGSYVNISSTAVFDGAVGAMIGAALGVTFHGLDAATIVDMLYIGVNERTFLPFFLEGSGGVLNITGSAFRSKLMDVSPGGTPPSFSVDVFAALDTFVYNGRQCVPTPTQAPNGGFSVIGYMLGNAIAGTGTSGTQTFQLAASSMGLADICQIARQGGPDACQRLAILCCELGMRKGNAFFPTKWKEAIVKPKNALSIMQFIYKLQTQLGFILTSV